MSFQVSVYLMLLSFGKKIVPYCFKNNFFFLLYELDIILYNPGINQKKFLIIFWFKIEDLVIGI